MQRPHVSGSRDGSSNYRGDVKRAIPYAIDTQKNETDMKKMIDKYDAKHKITQENRKIRDPWDSQRERIRRKLANKVGRLRRLGCHRKGLDTATARLVARTMCDAISIDSSEVWQMKKVENAIEAQLNEAHRRILGVEYSTAMTGVRHELGCVSQRLRRP